VGLLLRLLVAIRPVSAVVATDRVPQIDKVAQIPERFAVDIAHPFATGTQGYWDKTDSETLWHYTLRVPGAVSLSFHARAISLPPSAVLLVAGGSQQYRYSSKDIRRGELWSRIAHGDTLACTLAASRAEADVVVFEVSSIQVGDRSLGGRGPKQASEVIIGPLAQLRIRRKVGWS
jgi:hypothetical protein